MLESKLSCYVGILFKLKSFLPKYILSKIYYAFIHSYQNYGLIIWGATPASNLSKLCRIQNKALRVITGTGWREHAPCTNLRIRSFPQLLITFLPPLRKFIHVILEIRQNQTNILFLFFIHHVLNVQLNLEAQRLGTPSLMT